MLNKELKGWYRVSITGWVSVFAYVFSGGYAYTEIYQGYAPISPTVPALWMGFVVVLMLFAKKKGQEPFGVKNPKQKGFSLVELIIVISIIGIIASIILTGVFKAKDKAYFVRSKKEFRSLETSLQLYLDDHDGIYPADTGRNIPPGLEEYLGPGTWPEAPYPGSIYDWDNWLVGGEKIYQFSIRFCNYGAPIEECDFPDEEWAKDFDSFSAIFYCFEGSCRSHSGKPYDHPGYCVNCQEPDIIRGD